MLNARLAALVTILIWISTLVSPTIFAQDTAGLPPGIRSVEVDGQPVDAVTVPVTINATPEISGSVNLEVPVLELVVGDDGAIRVSTELDDRGRFRVAVPQALANGQYSLSINDLTVSSVSVDSAAEVTDESPQPRNQEPFLDIARVVPYPVDFGASVPGIGSLDGRYFTLEENRPYSRGRGRHISAKST